MTNMVKYATISSMRTVNIAELKARLSAHIRHVRDGEEVLVCERNKPVARIIPCHLQDFSEQEKQLVARGILKPPLKRRRPSASWPKPAGNIPDGVLDKIWQEEREGR
jgi:prevent-host-death family protein